MANTTNFNWETPDDTDLVKDGAAAIRTLGSAIDTSLVDLKGGTTGQVLSKATNTDMDFTWVAQDDSNAIQNAIVDAKGDIVAASAADTPARLAVGTDNQRLVAASGEATGLKYVSDTQNTVIDAAGDLLYGTAADTVARLGIGTAGQVLTVNSGATAPQWATAASGGAYTLINTGGTTLSGTSITISTIPSTYKFLYLVVVDAYAGTADNIEMRFNGDTSTNYRYAAIQNSNTTISGYQGDPQDNLKISNHLGTSTDDNKKTFGIATITNYTATTGAAVFSSFWAYNAGSSFTVSSTLTGVHNNAAAISSLTLRTGNGNTFSGGTAYLYGVN